MISRNRSLVDLIQSELVKDFVLISYLRKHTDNLEVLEAIFRRMSSLPQRDLVELLPNIIYVFYNYRSVYIERELYKLCEKSETLYLIIRWAIKAYIGNHPKTTDQYLEDIFNHLDESFVNRSKIDIQNLTQVKLTARIVEYVNHKSNESFRVCLTNEFYTRIARITLNLKGGVKKNRKDQLHGQLQKYYLRFQKKMSSRASSQCMFGMFFPVPSGSNFIVNINYQYCFPFETKKRAPYKFVFETVSYDQLIKSQRQKEQFSKSMVALQDVVENENQSSEDQESKDNGGFNSEDKETADKLKNYIRNFNDLDPLHETPTQATYLNTEQTVFEEDWKVKLNRIKQESLYRDLKSHMVRAYLVKGGDDFRQEFFAMQLIKLVSRIWREANIKLWVRPYDVIILSETSGFIEYLPNTVTLSSLKKNSRKSLLKIYQSAFGGNTDSALKNFTVSLAGYSLIQYIFQVKDRHNGNIMIDPQGHIIHIDFSFFLGSSPGNVGFQKAPFKMVRDYIEMMDGQNSELFKFFKEMLFLGFCMLKGYIRDILDLISVMKEKSSLPCFYYYRQKDMEYRLMSGCTDSQIRKRIDTLLYQSIGSRTTAQYDMFQYLTNGIFW